jgi:corrinoid protein of di/trimethylamine methyltransferase
MDKELLELMKHSILDGDDELAATLAESALEKGQDLSAVMNEGFLKGIEEVGVLYQAGDFYLPELVCAANAMKAALDVLTPILKNSADGAAVTKGLVVLATVQGDVHDIGKTIVGAMLTANGYEVCDLGIDVPNQAVIEAVAEKKPQILGLSALLTTTMEEQKNIIRLLEKENLRHQVKVIVGGAPVSSGWAETIRADGYSDSAVDAVKLAAKLLTQAVC